VDPRTGRSVQVQGNHHYSIAPIRQTFYFIDSSLGDLIGFYSFHNHSSPCILLHTLSYVNISSTTESIKPSLSAPTTPRKRRLGEAPTPFKSTESGIVKDNDILSTETSLTDLIEAKPLPLTRNKLFQISKTSTKFPSTQSK
jgi:hypothetical protein